VIDGDIRAAGATSATSTLPQQNSTIKLNMTDNSRWDGASYITVLNDDDSETDRLQVLGNTSGNTFVAVNNIGGAGAQTIEGIE
ncbi:autotransporter outer membrane beta-barrel domain-containing protein, partial [Salmonella enterica]|uniref:autotransporter outer membrane beta-barrel domain-containing protein n=1 Tax=Salmonella enterica TaxID=28901 RepID=UPI001C448963